MSCCHLSKMKTQIHSKGLVTLVGMILCQMGISELRLMLQNLHNLHNLHKGHWALHSQKQMLYCPCLRILVHSLVIFGHRCFFGLSIHGKFFIWAFFFILIYYVCQRLMEDFTMSRERWLPKTLSIAKH